MAARSVALVRHSIIDFAILLIRCIVHSAIAMASTGAKLIRTVIKTSKAPVPLGPYSQAVKVGPTLYLSGSIGIDPATNEFAGNDVETQTRQAMINLQAVLKEAGMTFQNVVKTTILLEDINDFTAMNEVYASFLSSPYPARAAYQVAKLPKLAKVEIEMIASD